MSGQRPPKRKTHVVPERPPFERVALLLQGGGALGSYQAGVYQALHEANLQPDWVAGISIGAINSALIVGNAPEKRVDRLRAFWTAVSEPPFQVPALGIFEGQGDVLRTAVNQIRAFGVLLGGAPGFFTPRLPPPFLQPPGSPGASSYYDVGPLKTTLEQLVDFELLNAGAMRLSVGAVNVRSGNFVYFDTTKDKIRAEHIIASGSLPPGFPATEIEGEHYWDGGLVSNTPLEWVLNSRPRVDTLAFQVDLWSAKGELPADLTASEVRQKEIRFSSRTRAATNDFKRAQELRRATARLLKQLPAELKHSPEAELLRGEACEKVFNIVQLIYRARKYEGTAKDYEFSRLTMEEHWDAGYNDAVRTLRHPEALQRPKNADGVFTFDVAQHGGE